MRKTRKQIREERAEAVCREVRYQIAKCGGISDNVTLYNLLIKWMKVANKNKFSRP